MALKAEVLESAIEDIFENYQFLRNESPTAAERFFHLTFETIDHLCGWPETGRSCLFASSALSGIRQYLVKNFERY